MKQTDLRIGNLLMWEDESKEIVSITEILKRENYYSISFEGGCAQLDEFIPIPLTEEWLIEFGFIKTSDEFNYEKEYQLGDFYIRENKDSNIYYYEDTPLQYVHIIQNLYFALKNKELKLK